MGVGRGRGAGGRQAGAWGVGGVEVAAASGCGLERGARRAVEEQVAVGHRHGAPPHLERVMARVRVERGTAGLGRRCGGVAGVAAVSGWRAGAPRAAQALTAYIIYDPFEASFACPRSRT